MADVNISLVIKGEVITTGTFAIVPTPAPVAAEVAKLLEKAGLDKLKTAGEVSQACTHIQQKLNANHPGKKGVQVHVTLTAGGVKLIDKDMPL
jgi:hypothetical protein